MRKEKSDIVVPNCHHRRELIQEKRRMVFAEEKYELGGKAIMLRSANANKNDADMLIDYLKTVTGETRFLMCEPDEVKYTTDDELSFIKEHNESDNALLILVFVDGEYAGNCSFEGKTSSRRTKHRAGIGIALFQRFTSFGLGRLLLEILLREIKEQGYEQAELTVVGGNDRAYHLYESLGFKECGRIPKANKYDDGTYSDDILMALPL